MGAWSWCIGDGRMVMVHRGWAHGCTIGGKRRHSAALGGKRRHGRGTVGAGSGQPWVYARVCHVARYVFRHFFRHGTSVTWQCTSFTTFLTLTFVSDVAGTSFATISTRAPSSRARYVFRHNLTWSCTSFVILSPFFHHSLTTPPIQKSIKIYRYIRPRVSNITSTLGSRYRT